uniref:VPS52 subunit of GARP complex n=1 Tax=Acanthochromis polyacanthus TaxID=80966 RepID=A0A3Q1EF49_9TELE
MKIKANTERMDLQENNLFNLMCFLQKTDGDITNLNLGELDLTTDEFILDEVDIHIQANLEDDLVKEALRTGVDLRQYSKQVETELQRIEQASIKDCILQQTLRTLFTGGLVFYLLVSVNLANFKPSELQQQ